MPSVDTTQITTKEQLQQAIDQGVQAALKKHGAGPSGLGQEIREASSPEELSEIVDERNSRIRQAGGSAQAALAERLIASSASTAEAIAALEVDALARFDAGDVDLCGEFRARVELEAFYRATRAGRYRVQTGGVTRFPRPVPIKG